MFFLLNLKGISLLTAFSLNEMRDPDKSFDEPSNGDHV
jgi:hypothetical protein